jgi:hypothetical protein
MSQASPQATKRIAETKLSKTKQNQAWFCVDAASATWIVWATMQRPVSGLMDWSLAVKPAPTMFPSQAFVAPSGTATLLDPITVAGAVCECAEVAQHALPV